MIYILYAAIVIIVLWLVLGYNGLIRRKFRVQEAFSDIDIQLKRRHDLIPNLVESVKGYMAHESGVFEKVTEARTRAMGAQGTQAKADAENALSGTLKTLFAVAENYPQLKANENFINLQNELTDTEDKIQAARRFYNSNVMELNTAIQTFPTNILAKLFAFSPMEFFGVDSDAERAPVQVKF